MAHACPHATVQNWTLLGRVTLGETYNPNTGANILHQSTRTMRTHAINMYVYLSLHEN